MHYKLNMMLSIYNRENILSTFELLLEYFYNIVRLSRIYDIKKFFCGTFL